MVLMEHSVPFIGRKQQNGSFTEIELKIQNNECLIIAKTIFRGDESLELVDYFVPYGRSG